MERPKRIFTPDKKDLIFMLWKQGAGFSDIAKIRNAAPVTVFTVLRASAGIKPDTQTRNSQHLTLSELLFPC